MVNHLIGSESDFPCFDKAREGRGDLGPESDAAAALVLEAVELLHNLLPALRTEERLRLHYGEVNLASNAIRSSGDLTSARFSFFY
jgi:hypothetical protein